MRGVPLFFQGWTLVVKGGIFRFGKRDKTRLDFPFLGDREITTKAISGCWTLMGRIGERTMGTSGIETVESISLIGVLGEIWDVEIKWLQIFRMKFFFNSRIFKMDHVFYKLYCSW